MKRVNTGNNKCLEKQKMRRESVNLVKQKVKTKKDTYEYWYVRWFGTDGKYHGKSIGRVDRMSRRQAEKIRQQKVIELMEHPGRRNVSRAFRLSEYIQLYFNSRKTELASGTIVLHQMTTRYLLGFFGENRRIDQISRTDARAFKAALANGDLMHISKKPRDLGPATVDIHIRNCNTMFNRAVDDDIIIYNPFDRLSSAVKVERDWHYVTREEYEKMMRFAPMKFRLLISLCRLAGLRRGEALNLRWYDIDWEHNRVRIIAKEEWLPKDREKRIVPVCPELQSILLGAYDEAEAGSSKVIKKVVVKNIWRDTQVLFCKAGVVPYSRPYHSLRKSCARDWAERYPAHVVKEWMGHSSFDTTDKYYLQVPESEYMRASDNNFWKNVTQNVTQNADLSRNEKEIGGSDFSQPIGYNKDTRKAGERIRTADVQLGKLTFYH
jgi:integrase